MTPEELHLRFAILLELQNDFNEALTYCEKVIHARPLHPEAYFVKATIKLKLHQKLESLQLYKKAILLKPDLNESYKNLGRTLSSISKPDGAYRQIHDR